MPSLTLMLNDLCKYLILTIFLHSRFADVKCLKLQIGLIIVNKLILVSCVVHALCSNVQDNGPQN